MPPPLRFSCFGLAYPCVQKSPWRVERYFEAQGVLCNPVPGVTRTEKGREGGMFRAACTKRNTFSRRTPRRLPREQSSKKSANPRGIREAKRRVSTDDRASAARVPPSLLSGCTGKHEIPRILGRESVGKAARANLVSSCIRYQIFVLIVPVRRSSETIYGVSAR